jgi:hypothetical protein
MQLLKVLFHDLHCHFRHRVRGAGPVRATTDASWSGAGAASPLFGTDHSRSFLYPVWTPARDDQQTLSLLPDAATCSQTHQPMESVYSYNDGNDLVVLAPRCSGTYVGTILAPGARTASEPLISFCCLWYITAVDHSNGQSIVLIISEHYLVTVTAARPQ